MKNRYRHGFRRICLSRKSTAARLPHSLIAAALFVCGLASASSNPSNPKYDPNTYPAAGGNQVDINGTWILVGNYTLNSVSDGTPVTRHYQAREIMRIRPGGAPTLSQLQLCDAFFDWGAPATISNTAHVISIPSYRFTVQSMTQMQVVTQLSAEDFKLSGEMVARKLSNDPSGSLGFITISASTIDLEEGEVTLFSKQKFAVSCFSEMESHDRERSIFNIFREIIPGLPVAMISASHSMQVAFNNHYMKVDSETLVGPGAPEGHMVTLYKDANPSDDDIPSSKTFSTMGGRPQNFMSHLYDQTPQLNSVFRFEGVNIQGAHPPVAEGTLVLDVGASSERRNELHQPTLPR